LSAAHAICCTLHLTVLRMPPLPRSALHGGQQYNMSLDLSTVLHVEIGKTYQRFARNMKTPNFSLAMLRNPPLPLIRNVFLELVSLFGCASGIVTQEEVRASSLSSEGKLRFLQKLAAWASAVLGDQSRLALVDITKLAIDPVLKNILLQELIDAAVVPELRVRWQAACEAARRSGEVTKKGPAGDEEVLWGLFQVAHADAGMANRSRVLQACFQSLALARILCVKQSQADMVDFFKGTLLDEMAKTSEDEMFSFQDFATLCRSWKADFNLSTFRLAGGDVATTQQDLDDALKLGGFGGLDVIKTSELHAAVRQSLAVVSAFCGGSKGELEAMRQAARNLFGWLEMTPCEETRLSVSALCDRLRGS